jgi:hypothetical protein
MNLTYQAQRRDALLYANVHSLNATRAPTVDETPKERLELIDAGAIADALQGGGD